MLAPQNTVEKPVERVCRVRCLGVRNGPQSVTQVSRLFPESLSLTTITSLTGCLVGLLPFSIFLPTRDAIIGPCEWRSKNRFLASRGTTFAAGNPSQSIAPSKQFPDNFSRDHTRNPKKITRHLLLSVCTSGWTAFVVLNFCFNCIYHHWRLHSDRIAAASKCFCISGSGSPK